MTAVGRSYPLTKGSTGLNRTSVSSSKAAVQNVGVETERRAVADEAFGKLAIKIGFQRFTSVVPFQNGPSVLSRLIDFVLGIVVHVLLFIVAARPIPVDKAIEYPLRYGGIFSRNRGD